MTIPKYPQSGELMITFLYNVRRFNVTRMKGINPALISVDGKHMYVYIRNISPAQLSNDNPDISRIQLPKRNEFEEIKNSNIMFILLGYDFTRKVYTSWNPYICKQRLNVAESCSMYSRYSLQKKVSETQKIEKIQLQNEGEVICIPPSLLGNYLKNINSYFQEVKDNNVELGYDILVADEKETNSDLSKHEAEVLFNIFTECFDKDEFVNFLINKGYHRYVALNYMNRLKHVFECGLIQKFKFLFLESKSLREYNKAIDKIVDIAFDSTYESIIQKETKRALYNYILYVEKEIEEIDDEIKPTEKEQPKIEQDEFVDDVMQKKNDFLNTPSFELDGFGKLKSLDDVIIEAIKPKIIGVDYPDYESITRQIKKYYPEKATEKMTPSDWIKLFEGTSWKNRVKKNSANRSSKKKTFKLRIIFPNGRIIDHNNVSTTYCEFIKEVGTEKVNKLNICHAGVNIVSQELHPKYSDYQREIGGGWYVMTNSSTINKYQDVINIINNFDLDVKALLIPLDALSMHDAPATEKLGVGREKIRVVFPDGRTIQPSKVLESLIEVVKYAGASRVHSLSIICCGDNLVLKNPSSRYIKASKDVGGGWFCNTCSDTQTKYNQIKTISERLSLGLIIELVQSDYTNNDISESYIAAESVPEYGR